jgi:hypothetical protein
MDIKDSQAGKQVDIFKPKTFGVILHFAMVLLPVWHRSLFKNKVVTRRSIGDKFLKVVSIFFQEELTKIEDDLGAFCAALDFTNDFKAFQSEEGSTSDGFLGLVVNQPNQVAKSSQNHTFDLNNLLHEPSKLITLSKDSLSETRSARSAGEILGLFANLSTDELLIKSFDHTLMRFLLTQYIDDLIDNPSEVSQLKQIYFKFIEVLIIEHKPLPPVLLTSLILSPEEIGLFREFVELKIWIKNRKELVSTAQSKGVSPNTMPNFNEVIDRTEKIVGSLLGKSKIFHIDYLNEILENLLTIDKLDIFVELLINRLTYLQKEKANITLLIENSKKVLGQSQETLQNDQLIQNWFHFSSAEKERLENYEHQVTKLDSEGKQIFTQILSIFYDVSGVEQVEEEIIKLPNFLREFGWISWLWDLIYCNRKTVTVRTNLAELKEACPEKMSRVQTYMADRKADSRQILLDLLRKVFSSSNEELRKSIMLWLINEGKVALVEEIDPNMSDEYLTSSLCTIIKSESLMSGDQALANHRFLIKNMASRKQHASALKLIQELLDNGLLTTQHTPTMAELTAVLMGDDNEQKRLFNLDPNQAGELRIAARQLPVIPLQERVAYVDQALQLLKEADANQLDSEKYKLVRYFEERRRACEEQTAIHAELAALHHKLTKVLAVLKRLASTNDPLAASVFADPREFVERDYGRLLAGLERRMAQAELVSVLLNVKLWPDEVLFNRLVLPLELHKLVAVRATAEGRMPTSVKVSCIKQSIEQLLATCARYQTLADVFYLADNSGSPRAAEIPYYSQLSSTDSRSVLLDFLANEMVWPANAKSQLAAVFRSLSQSQGISEPDKRELCTSFLKPAEWVTSRHAFTTVLLSNANEYIQTDSIGVVRLAKDKPLAGPFIEVYSPLSAVWTGDLLAATASNVLRTFAPAVGACNDLLREYVVLYGKLQERKRLQGYSEHLEEENDQLSFNFIR